MFQLVDIIEKENEYSFNVLSINNENIYELNNIRISKENVDKKFLKNVRAIKLSREIFIDIQFENKQKIKKYFYKADYFNLRKS